MSAIELVNQTDSTSSINSHDLSNTKSKKVIKCITHNKLAQAQPADVRKDAVPVIAGTGIVVEEQHNSSSIKKPRKSRGSKVINKIDTPSINSDSEENQNTSLKRKRGRPPKCTNEITKSHWLGFFAFIAENGYFDLPK